MRSNTEVSGASKDKALLRIVPLTAATVIACRLDTSNAEDWQATELDDVQAAVMHRTLNKTVVAEKSLLPKSSPETVTEAPPVLAIFRDPNDATGASNVNRSDPVPLTAPTVSRTVGSVPLSC